MQPGSPVWSRTLLKQKGEQQITGKRKTFTSDRSTGRDSSGALGNTLLGTGEGPTIAARAARYAAVLRGFSAVSFFPPSLLRDSHAGKRSRKSLLSFGSSVGAALAKDGRSSAAWPTRTSSARLSSSRNKGSITLSTSVATDNRKLSSARASGTIAAALSVASQSLTIRGASALAV